MTGPTVDFWQQRFQEGVLPWDRGGPHPQLTRWLGSGTLRSGQAVLVPGCGAGHEVVALAAAGLQVTALDYAPGACALARQAVSAAELDPATAQVIEADVRTWQPAAPLEAVYEQTCLCALHPDHWRTYADQLHRWLRPGGRLFGLFMQCRKEGAAVGQIEGPPYHLDIHAVRALFPADRWDWPKPPYEVFPHPRPGAGSELAVVLTRR